MEWYKNINTSKSTNLSYFGTIFMYNDQLIKRVLLEDMKVCMLSWCNKQNVKNIAVNWLRLKVNSVVMFMQWVK